MKGIIESVFGVPFGLTVQMAQSFYLCLPLLSISEDALRAFDSTEKPLRA